MPTKAQIEAARTPKGGFTREQLAMWGVSWPPPHGWMKSIMTEPDGPGDDEPIEPLNAEREERIAVGKAKMMVKKLFPNHPRRVELEEFLRRPRWSRLASR